MFDIAATLCIVSDTIRREPAPQEPVPVAADTHERAEVSDRERVCELRREIRERRGAEAALRNGLAELKSALAQCGQERDQLAAEKAAIEEQLRQAQKMAAVGRLAGGVAHDFNNVLSVIAGSAELLLRQVGASSPHRRRLEQLLQATQRGAGLTRQILAFSRKTVASPKPIDLGALVMEMKAMLEHMVGEDVRLTVAAEDGLGVVKADPGRIEQVLMNLAVNARDAMPQGGALRITLANEEGRVRMDVADTGSGMDAETAAHIFEPFFTTKDVDKGTGLGLATVHDIVRQSEGTITVESVCGRGTTFRIGLPRVDEWTPRQAAAVPMASPDGILPGGRETILLVEDDQFLREVVAEALMDAGYEVLPAASGAEALQKAREHRGPIHMALTDVVMPEMGGHDLARGLDPVRAGIRMLYMSGYTAEDIATRGLVEPGARLMQKPFTTEILLGQVRETLARPRCGMWTETSLAANVHVS